VNCVTWLLSIARAGAASRIVKQKLVLLDSWPIGALTTQKSLATRRRIVTRGMTPVALGEFMRTSKRFPRRGLRFRSLLVMLGALLLVCLIPRANADLIAYFNFEGTPTPPYAVNLVSQVPPGFATTTLILTDGSGNPYPTNLVRAEPGIPLNVAPGDPDPNLTDIHFIRNVPTLNMDIPLISSQGIYDITSVSFAYRANQGGSFVQLQYSTNNGITFQNISGLIALPRSTNGSVINIPVPAGTTINVNNLVLRLQFTVGSDGKQPLHTAFDNIQVNGTIVPEPATVAGGLLGVLALCWHQRRRLMRSIGFRGS
jgi:hypothetical protein